MIACVKCRREMRGELTGVPLVFGTNHVYPGDMFKCPGCGVEIVRAAHSIHDPNALKNPHAIQMQQERLNQTDYVIPQ